MFENKRNISLLLVIGFMLMPLLSGTVQAQEKKNRVRLSATFINQIGGDALIEFKASSRIDKSTQAVAGIDLNVFDQGAEQEIELGTASTDENGTGSFIIGDLDELTADSTGTYTLAIRFKGNDSFRKASRTISFKRVMLNAELIQKDSLNYVKATLIESDTIAISGEALTVQVDRLFSPLIIGDEFNLTDESGTVIVPIEEGIPGIDGNLTLIVGLFDSDDYGTVKAKLMAPVASPVQFDTSYDERTLWSPRAQTPYFILFFTLFLIFGSWGLIAYLISNLFKISKN